MIERGTRTRRIGKTTIARELINRAGHGYTWTIRFDDVSDDMFAHWPLGSPRRGGAHLYALEAKHGIALPPPHGPDFAEILLGFVW